MLTSKNFPTLLFVLQIWNEVCSRKSLRFDFGLRLGEIQGLVFDIGQFIELFHHSFSNI